MFSRALALTALALAGSTSAAISNGGLKILAPGGPNLWWLQGQPNNLVWTCAASTFKQFSVYLNNSDVSLITAITAIISVEDNFNCNQGIGNNLVTAPVGTGYTIVLTDITNITNIYAVSDPFDIKPLSTGYPPASATPVDQASATVSKGSASAGASKTDSGATPGKTGGASRGSTTSLVGAALALGALGLMAVV
ncbi:hypothetical protein B0H15DRAFT_798048 [Mycena belliarum]|uniref:Uncharacterized protein n=1 Tax=Mycena belliarum TaxID=1033014 RepID=A0AAD6XUF6_9AGAR|nr:hypothetical protein B0H15DRAFT_798048 [Mycena belliae]